MSLVAHIGTAGRPGGERRSAAAPGSLFASVPAMVALGTALAIIIGLQPLLAVWHSGEFFDSDDAMQIVQLRDWMGGQGWYDNVARRMDPPHGVLMHWTHIVEIPMALLTRTFGLFASTGTAERMMRIVYPLLLQIVLLWSTASVARRLLGAEGVGVAVILAALSLAAAAQFTPGRISHNSAQVVLLMLMLRATIDAFDVERPRSGAVAGAVAALSLAISLENLPFIAMMAAIFGVAWIARGQGMKAALAWFGGGFSVSSLAAFLAVVPPERFFQSACDAFSAAYLIAVAIGGIGFLALAAATTALRSPLARSCAAAACGLAVVSAIAATYPECLQGPFSAVDPVVLDAWLHKVGESEPLGAYVLRAPLTALPVVMPIALGLVATFVAAWHATGVARSRWLAVAAFATIGVAGAVWQIRVTTYTAAITLFGAAWLFCRSRGWAARRRRAVAAIPIALMLPFVPAAWAVAVPAPEKTGPQTYGDPAACLSSAAIGALGQLPASTIMSSIDPGPFILALTSHKVVTGPYHRDNRGLRRTIDTLLGNPATARARLRSAGADDFAFCPAANELAIDAARAPDGFIARLRRGEVPPWLQQVDVPNTPYRVYRIRG